jgi:hypothetical protein
VGCQALVELVGTLRQQNTKTETLNKWQATHVCVWDREYVAKYLDAGVLLIAALRHASRHS